MNSPEINFSHRYYKLRTRAERILLLEIDSYYRELIGQTFSINIKPTIGTNQ